MHLCTYTQVHFIHSHIVCKESNAEMLPEEEESPHMQGSLEFPPGVTERFVEIESLGSACRCCV